MMKFWFEQEINIWNDDNVPVNYISGQIASKHILDILSQNKKYKKLKNTHQEDIAKPELDASQIEIHNPLSYQTLEQAQEELYECFLLVESIIKSEWYRVVDSVVPNQDFDPVISGAKKHYVTIHNMLLKYGMKARKATNITGTHMTFTAGDDRKNHITVSNKVRDLLLQWNMDALLCTTKRLQEYKRVVDVLSQEGLVSWSYVPHFLWDESEWIITRDLELSYAFVRPKQTPSWEKLSELRVVDGPISSEDVLHKSYRAYDIVMSEIL